MKLVLYPPTDVNFELEHQAQNNYQLKVGVPQVPRYKILLFFFSFLRTAVVCFFCFCFIFCFHFVFSSVRLLAAAMIIFGQCVKFLDDHLKQNEYNNNINLVLWSSTCSSWWIFTFMRQFITVSNRKKRFNFFLLLFWCGNKCENDWNIWWLVVCCFPWSV